MCCCVVGNQRHLQSQNLVQLTDLKLERYQGLIERVRATVGIDHLLEPSFGIHKNTSLQAEGEDDTVSFQFKGGVALHETN